MVIRTRARSARPTTAEQLIDAVTAHLRRTDLSPVEEAKAFARLKDAGRNARQIAREIIAVPRAA